MSNYTLTSVTLPSLSGVHDGTGPQAHSWNVCDPSSVGMGVTTPLRFVPITGQIEALCFDLSGPALPAVPQRFAVAVRVGAGMEAFTRANIFFHPNPANAGMTDATYPTGGLWPRLYRYMQNLGTAMAAAGNKMVLIMPYMTASSSSNAGILGSDWHELILAVMNAAKAKLLPGDSSKAIINELVVSSYSFGIRYSDSFRRLAGKSLDGVLHSVWDFDGMFSSEALASAQLQTTAQYKAIKYDQAVVSSTANSFHVPLSRWTGAPPPPPKNDKAVHQVIPANLFLHACKVSGVG